MKTEHKTEDQRIHVVELYFLSTNQSTHSGFIRGFNKMAEAEGSLKYGFQERCVSSLVFFMVVQFSLDTKNLCLFLHLFIIPALIRVLWPYRTFFQLNFSHVLQLVPVFK